MLPNTHMDRPCGLGPWKGGGGEIVARHTAMIWRFLAFMIFFETLTACRAETTQPVLDPSGPDSKRELCLALGKDPKIERLCNYTSDGELRDLLLSVFPIGIATKTDVNTRL